MICDSSSERELTPDEQLMVTEAKRHVSRP